MFNNKRPNSRSLYFSDRLTEVLSQIPQYPLTVMEAPMGYGKTTAIQEYAAKNGITTLWKTVRENDEAHFWSDFCEVFAELDRDCSYKLAELGMPDDNTTRRDAAALIANRPGKDRVLFVIDDVHLLAGTAVYDFIVTLAQEKIPGFHVVIATRMVSLEMLEEMTLKGLAQHVTQAVFELLPSDIVKYYQRCGVRLKPQEAESLHSYTEGWISALYLCLLEFLQEGRFEKTVNLQELLAKTVYRPLTDELKDFLQRICVFDYFTMPQAQFAWPNHNAASLLKQLMAQNAFIRYDARRQVYHLHNIFVGYLRELFDGLAEETKKLIWQSAGEWHLTVADYLEAMRCFQQAGDFDRLLDAVELDKGNSIGRESKETVIRYFGECPPEIRNNHLLAVVVYVRELLMFGEMELFAIQCTELEREIAGVSDSKRRNRLAGELELVYMLAKYNDIVAMAGHIRRATELLPGESLLCDHNTPWTMGSPSVLYMFYREPGGLRQEVREMHAAMPLYYRVTANHGSGAEYVMQAEQHYNQGDFENADIVSHKAFQKAGIDRQTGSMICALFVQVRVALAQGDLALARELLDEMRTMARTSRQGLYLHTIDLCEGFLFAQLNQPNQVADWIGVGDFSAGRLLPPVLAYFNVIHGRVLLISGQERKALGLADYWADAAEHIPHCLSRIYTQIYRAAANEKLFRRNEALALLKQALNMALPDGMLMPFAENADLLLPLIEELGRDPELHGVALRIADLSKGVRQVRAALQESLNGVTDRVDLTAREREIALLAADGLTNREIAAGLNISENTVKTLLKRSFEKIGVSSRAQLKEKI